MKLWIYNVVLWLFIVAGCTPVPPGRSERPDRPSVEGLKIQDLRNPDIEHSDPVVVFLITSYHFSPSQLPAVWSCCEGLSQEAIAFADKQGFEGSGFAGAMGTATQLGTLWNCLRQAGAIRFNQSTLLVNPNAEMPFGRIFINNQTSIKDAGDAVSLRKGYLSWTVKPYLNAPSFRQTAVELVPMFMPEVLAAWPGADQFTLKMSHRFKSGQLSALFQEGDFIVLTGRHDDPQQMTDVERALFFEPDQQPYMRLYVVVFVRVDQ